MSRRFDFSNEAEEHENHERWLVSYADFITLLFAFFVMLYAMSVVNISKYEAMSEGLLNAFGKKALPTETLTPPLQAPMPSPKTLAPAKADPMDELARKLSQTLSRFGERGQVTVKRESRGVLVEISAGVLFASGRAEIQTEPSQLIREIAQHLVPLETRIQVEGFTDNVPIASPLYPTNWELSAARAASVARILIEEGARSETVTIAGHGENRPVAGNETEEGRAKNRRVRMLIAPGSASEQVIELSDYAHLHTTTSEQSN